MSVHQLKAIHHLDPNTEINCYLRSKKNPFNSIPHSHDFYEITLITSGAVTHHINNTKQLLYANTIIFLRAQDIHYFNYNDSNVFEYINLSFSSKTLKELFLFLDDGFDIDHYMTAPMPPIIHLSPSDALNIRRKIDMFTLIPADDSIKKKAVFRLLLADLFFKYFQTPYKEINFQPSWFNDLIHKINEPENFIQGTACLEKLSGKNIAYISRLFKEKLQTTPTNYINDLRLNYCANRLIHSDTSIVDISFDAGFNNLSHFYHLFKEKYQSTPNKYREENSTNIEHVVPSV